MFRKSFNRHASRVSAAIAVLGVTAVCAGPASAHAVSTRPVHAVAKTPAVALHARYGAVHDSGVADHRFDSDAASSAPVVWSAPVLTQAQINQIIAWMRAHLFMFPRGSFG